MDPLAASKGHLSDTELWELFTSLAMTCGKCSDADIGTGNLVFVHLSSFAWNVWNVRAFGQFPEKRKKREVEIVANKSWVIWWFWLWFANTLFAALLPSKSVCLKQKDITKELWLPSKSRVDSIRFKPIWAYWMLQARSRNPTWRDPTDCAIALDIRLWKAAQWKLHYRMRGAKLWTKYIPTKRLPKADVLPPRLSDSDHQLLISNTILEHGPIYFESWGNVNRASASIRSDVHNEIMQTWFLIVFAWLAHFAPPMSREAQDNCSLDKSLWKGFCM